MQFIDVLDLISLVWNNRFSAGMVAVLEDKYKDLISSASAINWYFGLKSTKYQI